MTNDNKVKKWRGSWPAKCDGCEIDLKTVLYFYDAPDREGHWGLWCPDCHLLDCGTQLGPGLGQEYDSKTLEKIEG